MERWLHDIPLKAKVSNFRATIVVPHKSTSNYSKSMPMPMITRKKPRPPNPRRLENQNILPFTIGKTIARRVFNWPKLSTSRNSRI
jgi:hypothetical protein